MKLLSSVSKAIPWPPADSGSPIGQHLYRMSTCFQCRTDSSRNASLHTDMCSRIYQPNARCFNRRLKRSSRVQSNLTPSAASFEGYRGLPGVPSAANGFPFFQTWHGDMHISIRLCGPTAFGLSGILSNQFMKVVEKHPCCDPRITPVPKGCPRLCVTATILPSASAGIKMGCAFGGPNHQLRISPGSLSFDQRSPPLTAALFADTLTLRPCVVFR